MSRACVRMRVALARQWLLLSVYRSPPTHFVVLNWGARDFGNWSWGLLVLWNLSCVDVLGGGFVGLFRFLLLALTGWSLQQWLGRHVDVTWALNTIDAWCSRTAGICEPCTCLSCCERFSNLALLLGCSVLGFVYFFSFFFCGWTGDRRPGSARGSHGRTVFRKVGCGRLRIADSCLG